MPNTAAVYARIDPQLKKDAEAILNELLNENTLEYLKPIVNGETI